jgi:hypothetical protein
VAILRCKTNNFKAVIKQASCAAADAATATAATTHVYPKSPRLQHAGQVSQQLYLLATPLLIRTSRANVSVQNKNQTQSNGCCMGSPAVTTVENAGIVRTIKSVPGPAPPKQHMLLMINNTVMLGHPAPAKGFPTATTS